MAPKGSTETAEQKKPEEKDALEKLKGIFLILNIRPKSSNRCKDV